MKIVKLALAFIVLVGAIFALLNWNSGKTSFTLPSEADREKEVSEKCDAIRSEWAQQSDWNNELYRTQAQRIEQIKGVNLLTESEINTISDCLRETASNKITEAIFREFHSSACNDRLVSLNYSGVGVLCENNTEFFKDARMAKIKNCYDLYCKIKTFVNSSHTITPRYDSGTNTWVSFSNLRQKVMNMAEGYKKNSFYKELEGINAFSKGLNTSNLEKVLDPQKRNFYSNLENQIRSYYEHCDKTQHNYSKLQYAYGNLAEETEVSFEFVRRFKKQLDEQEEGGRL